MPPHNNPPYAAEGNPANYDRSLELCLGKLLEDGAQLVIPQYSVATEQQVDIVAGGKRYLLTPDDSKYHLYAETLQSVGLPFLKPDSGLSTEQVIVGELPRDARPVAQILRSKPSLEGATPDDVMRTFGGVIAKITLKAHVLPNPSEFALDRVLVRRLANDVMLLPPLSFVEPSEHTGKEFTQKIEDNLWSKYASYRATPLYQAFLEGLQQ